MSSRNRNFFDPREVEILYAAVDRAFQVLTEAGVKAQRNSPTDDLLARGVLKAARYGKLDITRLSRAACEHWIANATDFSTGELATVH